MAAPTDDPGPRAVVAGAALQSRVVSGLSIRELVAARQDESLELWARTINPQFARVLRTIGFDRTWARAQGAYLWDDEGNRFLDMLGACAIPLGVLLSGAMLADLLRQPGSLGDWKTCVGAVLLRLAVLPALVLATAVWTPMTATLRQVLAVQAAMPAAVFPIILARRYGGHELTAVRVLVFTTVAAVVTSPAAVALALRWVGT